MSASDSSDPGVRPVRAEGGAADPPRPAIARALIDGDGRLVSADAPIAGLQAGAGGRLGGAVAVPQFAALARLVRRLGTPVERAVIAAAGDRDIEIWVRARPDGGAVELAIADCREMAAFAEAGDPDEREHDFLRADADWTWESDAGLRVTALSEPALTQLARHGIMAPVGEPLARLFRLVESGAGELPLLLALAEQVAFEDQRVALRRTGHRFRLDGRPLLDGNGGFAGFRGTGVLLGERGDPAAPARTSAFAARLDHALRQPLDRIIARAESIRTQGDGPVTPEYAGYAGDIATAGRHLLGLVDDLVDLEAIERPDFRPPVEPIDLADLARRAAGLLAVRAANKDIRVERPVEGLRVPAIGDFRRTLQILVNLVGNAVRFSPPGTLVRVDAREHDGRAEIIVADAGPGIPRKDQDKIFAKFERLGATEPGTGLGLYIARKLARAMGGEVTVDSRRGRGARFILTLPGTDPSD